jgi:hypothetical protein
MKRLTKKRQPMKKEAIPKYKGLIKKTFNEKDSTPKRKGLKKDLR